MFARVALELADIVCTGLGDGAVRLRHEEADREALRVDGVSVIAVAGGDESGAVDPIPRLTLLAALVVAKHLGHGFLRRVALGLGDEVAVRGGPDGLPPPCEVPRPRAPWAK